MNKRHENKYSFDPARLSHTVSIYRIENTDTEDGGTTTEEVLYLTTKAGVIFRSANIVQSDYSSQQITDGVTNFTKLRTYVIRYRKGINITPDMIIIEGGIKYEIVGNPTIEGNDPKTFIFVSCSKLEG